MKKFVAVSLMVMMVWVSPQGLAHSGPPVPTPVGLAEIAVAFEWDFDATEITAERISDQLYVLFGAGGNIAVSVGAQGVLVVDDQFPALADKIRAAIKDLGGNQVDFVVNTHWHFDHADGNQFLAALTINCGDRQNHRLTTVGQGSCQLDGQKAGSARSWPTCTRQPATNTTRHTDFIEVWHSISYRPPLDLQNACRL